MTRAAEDALAGGSVSSRMLRIAAPLSLAALFRYGVELSNTYWVGRLGVAQLSIATALGTFLTVSTMFAGLTSAGTSAVIGRMLGQRRLRPPTRLHRAADGLHVHDKAQRSAAVAARQVFGHHDGVEQVAAPAAEFDGDDQRRQPGGADVGEVGIWELAAAILFAGALGKRFGQAIGELQEAGLSFSRWKIHESLSA